MRGKMPAKKEESFEKYGVRQDELVGIELWDLSEKLVGDFLS